MNSIRNFELYWPSRVNLQAPASKRVRIPSFRVGEPFQAGRRTWPAGSHYIYGDNGHELVLIHSSIEDKIIQDVRRGEAEFAIAIRPSIFVLSYRFGRTIAWSDVAYSWHLQDAASREIPPRDGSPEARALLWVSLVGAGDGLIHAQRGIALAPEFSRVLEAAIRRQAVRRFDPHDCIATVQDLLVENPTPQARLRLASSRTLGNT